MIESYKEIPNGCKHHPDCFSCPFDDCLFGGMLDLRQQITQKMRDKALSLLRQGKGVPQVARELGVTKQTVYRYKAAAGIS